LQAQGGNDNMAIHVVAFCALNGRNPQLLVDPTVDLTQQQRSLTHAAWIAPLVEPLPDRAMDYPPSEWAQHFDLSPQLKKRPAP
jgi:vitamin K-dependent gamma-carboxylase